MDTSIPCPRAGEDELAGLFDEPVPRTSGGTGGGSPNARAWATCFLFHKVKWCVVCSHARGYFTEVALCERRGFC